MDAGKFVAALVATLEVARDGASLVGGEQLHGVERQVVGAGMAAAGTGMAEMGYGSSGAVLIGLMPETPFSA